jgi:hypothetical protein
VAVWMSLTVHVPGDVPDLWIDLLQKSGGCHLVIDDNAEDGREGFDGHREGGSGGPPWCAVLCETTAGHAVVEGWYWSCLPQGWRMPGKPGRVVPIKRSSLASRLRASDEALNMAW